ncbi:two-component system sensor histidine kinase DesK [Amycolatopsis bartoniae]|uniref:Two-component sensor histidine kinase n=1 Tax=Amycolatopsis bartoniae TaxID=941986 RepID=A0A8H9ITB3_9PSEU|nr:sensor histidine kinase [Amycolatopsis bartoniae]MBB2935695.1 two-component system sensor histidine kinase DesK [Amycolatopsis bartoniae]TVT02296.1 sensor histidine kinase [Amycolatopsis bartoniae]GHF61183.1 two-component sensor histidine kinase [Amycolatopsis bartoniae]
MRENVVRERGPEWGGWWREDTTGRAHRAWRFTARWWVAGSLFLLPVVLPSLRYAFAPGTPVAAAVALLVVVALYCTGYLLFQLVLFGAVPLWRKVAFCALMLALGWAVFLLLPNSEVYLLLYSIGVISFGLAPGWVLGFNGASLVALAVLEWRHVGNHGSFSDVWALLGISASMFFVGRLLFTVRTLRAARDEIATLAVTAERERLARDLHDILGHSLTTITVKAGLARRMLESGQPERAITEIAEVEGLSRSALSDVRATVSEYREVSLSAELVGARAALRAAEIEADLPHAVDNVRPDLQQAFGYVLREAVTNVLRHSGAKHVKVRFGRDWLDISDDGVGAPEGLRGNGLCGLAERLAQLGGKLHTESRVDGGFVLRAEVAS